MNFRPFALAPCLLLVQFSIACVDDPVPAPVGGSGGQTTGQPPGGTGGVPNLGGSGAGTSQDFELLFADDFDTLDTSRWQKASHTFAENAAQFAPDMVSVENGMLELRLEKADAPSSEGKLYRGGELRSLEFFGYGRFEARIKFAEGSGIVSSLFTFYDHYADPTLEENWNEIDIEFLGKDPNQVQFNVIHWNANDAYTSHEKHVELGFVPSAEFHDYAIEWLPTAVNFYVDGEMVHSQTDQVQEFLTLDSRLMMNIWPVEDRADLQAWAGVLDEASLPAVAQYDWVRVYRYTGN